jgi:hypothetical protein
MKGEHMRLRLSLPIFVLIAMIVQPQLAVSSGEPRDGASVPEGWRPAAPRDEIRPQFAFDPKGGRDGKGCFVITHDAREGLHGYWTKMFSVEGGRHYRCQGVARWRESSGRTTRGRKCHTMSRQSRVT